ncbi:MULTISPECIES: hypothetical protein [Anaerotruncus]|uniref:DUF4338 domain-containing protein n=1 Tax=Anaerotruncus massiliensis (ex Togo et al. 2019) TaxID=1673720 RepID=A0ABR7ACR2_9FIRM|nr:MULTISPECIES: hypothetical protein [Anaerotruncus]MBC3938198.1 hypothetical protein [Anaerotruncus massiliensis (ex Togo et al. 2019)]
MDSIRFLPRSGSSGKSKNPQKGPIVLRLSTLLSGFGFARVFSLVPGGPRRRCDRRRVRGYRPRTVSRASGISCSGIKSHWISYEFQGNGYVIKGAIPQKRPRENLLGFYAAFWSQILKIPNWKMKNKLQSAFGHFVLCGGSWKNSQKVHDMK